MNNRDVSINDALFLEFIRQQIEGGNYLRHKTNLCYPFCDKRCTLCDQTIEQKTIREMTAATYKLLEDNMKMNSYMIDVMSRRARKL